MKKLLSLLTDQSKKAEERESKLLQALIHYEAKIGGQLFGPIPAGHRREFFCLDEYTWVWHEEWDNKGQHQVLSTRYTVRPNAIVKSINGSPYQQLSKEEEQNFFAAVRIYEQRVLPELDRIMQTA